VCLPYPAVSGEHAAVVTILADSFLEDLGSTNGTLVNGKAVVKHFLRDNDHIDIGRQRLVYFSNDDAQAVPLLPDALRHEVRGLHDQVERVRERRNEERRTGKPAAPAGPSAEALALDEDLLADMDSAAGDEDAGRAGEADPPSAPALGASREPARPPKRPRDPSSVASRLASTWSPEPDAEGGGSPTPGEASGVTARQPSSDPARAGDADPLFLVYRVRVLGGPNEGRELVLNQPQVSVGRVGTQVARLSAETGGWRLATLEGAEPVERNGAPVPAEGVRLAPGDRFRVAATDLVFEQR
jgi:hypothetical protein